MLSAVFFNIINGFTNGYYFGSIVTTEYHNLRKLNMSGDDYITKLKLENTSEVLHQMEL